MQQSIIYKFCMPKKLKQQGLNIKTNILSFNVYIGGGFTCSKSKSCQTYSIK